MNRKCVRSRSFVIHTINVWLSLGILVLSIVPVRGQTLVAGFHAYLPQVARGSLSGLYLETIVVITNGGSAPVTVKVESFGLDFPQSEIELAPGERREIRFEGDPFQLGWVRLLSETAVTAAAHILVKLSPQSKEVLEHAVIVGQPLVSKAVIPVFFDTPVADDTGFALAYGQNGNYKFTLLDPAGEEVASRIEEKGFNLDGAPSDHAAMFVSQLFPEILEGFTSGTLVIEHLSPNNIAMAFAPTALYILGTELTTADVLDIDEPGSYLIFPKSTEDVPGQAAELAEVYGFEVKRTLDNVIEGIMTFEVARAVSRDNRIENVFPNSVGQLSSLP
ncbi:MAG: hypothetical protein ACRD1R_00180 [Acidobacteriota bacterium]